MKKTIFRVILSFLFCVAFAQTAVALDLSPGDISGNPDDAVTIPINLSDVGAGIDVDAFSFVISFDDTVLTFVSADKTNTLTSGFTSVDGQSAGVGQIKVSGLLFGSPISITSNGIFVNLNFTVNTNATQNSTLSLSSFLDDIAGATTTDGQFTLLGVTPDFTLSTDVLPAGSGSVGLVPSGGTYSSGTQVELTATAASADWIFDFWSGDLTLDTNPATITMDSDKNVTANFIPTYTLTVNVLPNGNEGTVAVDPPAGPYPQGSQVTLTAFANSGYRFDNWSDGASGTTNPVTITMNSNTTVDANFSQVPTQPLTINISPDGTAGTTSPPGPTVNVEENTDQTVTATANPGYRFTGWTGDVTDTNPTIVVAMGTAPKSITANFIAQYNLTMAADPAAGGMTAPSVSGSPHTYDSGDNVTIEATPSTGYTFVEWTGDATGATNPLTITMDSNKTITAKFATSHTVDFVAGVGGAISGPDPQTVVSGQQTQAVTATPDSSYQFVNWTEVGTGTPFGADPTNPVLAPFTVNQDLNIKANFELLTFDLTTSVATGSGTVSPATGPQTQNSIVNLSAQPDSGFHFVNWTGDTTTIADVFSANTTIIMDSAKSVAANFAADAATYTLDVATGGTGTGSTTPAVGTSTEAEGTVVNLTATHAAGSHFVEWQGDVADPFMESTSITMNGDKTVTAIFELDAATYALTLNVIGSGTATPNPAGPYNPGDPVTITAAENPDYMFVEWRGDVSDPGAPTTQVEMDSNKTVTAVFALDMVKLNMAVTGTGDVDPAVGTYYFLRGETVPISAIEIAGSDYVFANWSGGVANASAMDTTVLMDSDKDITANFALSTIALTVEAYPPEAGYTQPSGVTQQPADQDVTIQAFSNAGWQFSDWAGDGIADRYSSSTTVLMDQAKTVTAFFTQTTAPVTFDLTVMVEPADGGTTTPTGTVAYNENDLVDVSATPSEGYRFVEWQGPVADTTSAETTITITDDITITAVFEEDVPAVEYNLTISSDPQDGGTTTPAAGVHPYDENTEVTLTATEALGYRFVNWTGDVVEPDASMTTIMMDNNKTVVANFEEVPTYTLTMEASPAEGGTTDPGVGDHAYSEGMEVTLTAMPAEGFDFDGWSGDVTVTGQTTASVIMDEDQVVTALFTPEIPSGTVAPNKPVLVSPADGTTGVSLTPTLTTGDYVDMDNDPHDSTRWQISTSQGFQEADLVLNQTSNLNLTTLTVDAGILSPGTTYFWRARFIDGTNAASDWSDMFMFTIQTAGPADDQDGDGVPDDQEVDDPTSDVDNDGTSDADQNESDMLSLFIQSRICEGVIGVKGIENVEELVSLITLMEGSPYFPAILDAPCDFVGFEADVVNPGDSATITVYFSEAIPEDMVWYIYNVTTSLFSLVDGFTFGPDRRSVTFEIVDGGVFDADGAANGMILVLSTGYAAELGDCDATATFTAMPRTGEKPLTVNLDATGSTGALSWDYGDNTTKGSAMRSVHTYPEPGTYVVTLTATGTGGCTSTAVKTISVQAPPAPENDDNCFISSAGTGAMGYLVSLLAAAAAGLAVTLRRKR